MAFGVLLSNDLFFGSKVSGTAEALGLRVEVRGDVAQAVESACDPDCRCLMIDLEKPGLSVADLIAGLSTEPRPYIIAFGPHVRTALFEEARNAGCDDVLPRGRFSAELPQILQTHLTSPR